MSEIEAQRKLDRWKELGANYTFIFRRTLQRLTVFGPEGPALIIHATSGRPEYSDPKWEDEAYKGPIPEGYYQSFANELSDPSGFDDLLRRYNPRSPGDWGDWRIALHRVWGPRQTDRSKFFIHGGTDEGSAGCIDVGGGFFGSCETSSLEQIIFADADGIIDVYVQ